MRIITNINGRPFKKGSFFELAVLSNDKLNRYNTTKTMRAFEIDSGEDITFDIDLTDEMIILHLAHFL